MKFDIAIDLGDLAEIPFDGFLGTNCTKMAIRIDVSGDTKAECLAKIATWVRIIDIVPIELAALDGLTIFEARRHSKEVAKTVDTATLNIAYQLRTLENTDAPIAYKYALTLDGKIAVDFSLNEVV